MWLVRDLVYHLGFKPKPESIFYSPSKAFSTISIEEATRSVDWSQFHLMDKPKWWVYHNMGINNIDLIPSQPQPDDVSKMIAEHNWFRAKTPVVQPPVYQNDGLNVHTFHCPFCGGPLESGDYYFLCVHDGRFEIKIGGEGVGITVTSLRKN